MAEKKVVEVATAVAPQENIATNANQFQRSMAQMYKEEELVEIAVSPLYATEFSNNQPVILNGVRINVPCDNVVRKVPYSFALEIRNRIYLADEKTRRLNKMADTRQNFENTPGEIKLFR